MYARIWYASDLVWIGSGMYAWICTVRIWYARGQQKLCNRQTPHNTLLPLCIHNLTLVKIKLPRYRVHIMNIWAKVNEFVLNKYQSVMEHQFASWTNTQLVPSSSPILVQLNFEGTLQLLIPDTYKTDKDTLLLLLQAQSMAPN